MFAMSGLLKLRKDLPRGVRNNNPLNIRESKGDRTQWEGEHALDLDKSFEEFSHSVYGFRAGARVLRSYSRQGYKTLSEIIHRFAWCECGAGHWSPRTAHSQCYC